MRIASIGELLWDVFEDSEQIGGAPFNFAAHARRLGHDVVFLSAVGRDARGDAAIQQARELGLPAEFLQRVSGAPTGTVTVRLDWRGQPSFTIHRPAAYDQLHLDEGMVEKLAAWRPEWIYYGTLHQAADSGREATRRLIAAFPEARRFYDVNLRPDCFTAPLVEELMRQAHVVKLNEEEAAAVDRMFGRAHAGVEEFCRFWAARYSWQAISVTLGARGCAVLIGTEYFEAPGYAVEAIDTVGAGDAFAAALLHGLGKGWPPAKTGDFANRVAALVTSRPGGVPPWTVEECEALGGAAPR